MGSSPAGRIWYVHPLLHVLAKPCKYGVIPLAVRIEVFIVVLRRNPGDPAALPLAEVNHAA